jgi:hypothetical protein
VQSPTADPDVTNNGATDTAQVNFLTKVDPTSGGTNPTTVPQTTVPQPTGGSSTSLPAASGSTTLPGSTTVAPNPGNPGVSTTVATKPAGSQTSSNGSTRGVVFDDKNDDGRRSKGEKGIGGATVQLTDANGNVFTTTTDEDGNFVIDNLPPGTYTVVIRKNGEDVVAPFTVDVQGSGFLAVPVRVLALTGASRSPWEQSQLPLGLIGAGAGLVLAASHRRRTRRQRSQL